MIESMNWVSLALINSVLMAVYLGVNGRFKVDGMSLVFWRSVLVLVMLTPFLNWSFFNQLGQALYIGAIGSGVLIALADRIMFDVAGKYGGAMIGRLLPMRLWGAFALWFVFAPGEFWVLLEDLPRFIGIVTALSASIIALFYMTKCNLTKNAVIAFLPVIFLFMAADVLHKFAVDGRLSSDLSFWYIAVTTVVTMLVSLLINLKQGKHKAPQFFSKHTFYASFWVGISLIAILWIRGVALAEVPNPAYTSAISSLSAIWLLIYHKVRGIPDSTAPVAGLIFIISIIALTLLAAQ